MQSSFNATVRRLTSIPPACLNAGICTLMAQPEPTRPTPSELEAEDISGQG
jgi:hypothetical protein